jgi:RHH-type proline utilization regulon transcriptional repressor/proline dehydrogenase/delta 1-pyrroline-5-carboxylate dehydrogenase
MHARLAPARALHERIAHDPFREHDARTALASQLHHLLQQAGTIAQPRVLPGPTGESNTLHFGARGVLLCACREGAGESDVLLPALAALLAGNAVLLLSDAATGALVLAVRNLLAEAGFADGLTAHHALPEIAGMQAVIAACAMDGVLCHGDPALAQRLSRTLVARAGALLPLIDDDFGPLYLERFVHEKTISVNTAAAGGNAALMSQAESD